MIHVLPDNFQIYVIFFNSKLGLSWLKHFLKKPIFSPDTSREMLFALPSTLNQAQGQRAAVALPASVPIRSYCPRSEGAGLAHEQAGGQ